MVSSFHVDGEDTMGNFHAQIYFGHRNKLFLGSLEENLCTKLLLSSITC